MRLPGWSTTVVLFCDGCSWVPCLFWALFFRKVLQLLQILQFYSIFCIFEPFPAVTVWFWDPSFHTEDNWGTQTQLLKKVQTFTDAPEDTRCIKSQGDENFWTGWRCPNFSYFVEIYIFFPFSTALRKQQKILACFPEDKLSTIYLDLQIQKVFYPPALNASCVLLEHQWMFEPFLIVVFESLSCPQCEKMDLRDYGWKIAFG